MGEDNKTVIMTYSKTSEDVNNVNITLTFEDDDYWWEDKVVEEVFPVAVDLAEFFSRGHICLYEKLKKRTCHKTVLGFKRTTYNKVYEYVNRIEEELEKMSDKNFICADVDEKRTVKRLFVKKYTEDKVLWVLQEKFDAELMKKINMVDGGWNAVSVYICNDDKINYKKDDKTTVEFYALKTAEPLMHICATDSHEEININLDTRFVSISQFCASAETILKKYGRKLKKWEDK